MRTNRGLVVLITAICSSLCLQQAVQAQAGPATGSSRINLEKGWAIRSSAEVAEKGDVVSTDKFQPRGWQPAQIPSTVVAALVANKVYPDPYFGMNLRLIPGTTYRAGQNFSNSAMPAESPFAVPWWYRTEFKIPAAMKGKTLWLNFDGINNRANIWLNGRQVANSDRVAGMYRMFEFDVTDVAVAGSLNTLAVEIIPPTQNDLSITFVDWNPMPSDKDMGLVRDVYLLASGPVALRNVQVITKLAGEEKANLTVSADLHNASAQTVQGTLKGQIGSIVFSKKVVAGPRSTSRIEFAPGDSPQLSILKPKLWWPYPVGPQNLYRLHMEFESGGQVSDRQDVQFGIREFTSEIDGQQHRVFKINGKNILIRGGGWSPDMMLRFDAEREENEIRYTRDMNLNTIRLEGKMNNDHFYDTTDQYGILVMPGWCCCSYWERWKNWKPEDFIVAGESLRDQLRRLRNHPSVFTFLYGSDGSPTPEAEAVYLKVFQEEHWPNPYVSSATNAKTVGAGITGVKMTGPYEYVAPNYWLEDRQRGGAFGFNTETSPGPAIPELASLSEMLPKEHLWPIDEFWNFHAGGGSYSNVNVFTAALENRYGKAKGLEDYVKKSQLMAYEGERAMFEAFGRNKYTSTGVIQWMLNNAWPSIIWHLYDFYLRPGGGYFGTKKACEPLHVQYSYDDKSIVAVNTYYRSFSGHKVTAKVYNLDLTEKFSKTAATDIGPDSATRVFSLPDIAGLSSTYFVALSLQDGAGKQVSTNFYWLSTQPDVSDWARGNGRYTPISTYADLKGLETLPAAELKASSKTERSGAEQLQHVTISNPSSRLAFAVHLRLLKGKTGQEVLPVLWQDNYFPLLPGESRQITASYKTKDLGSAAAVVELGGWNVKTQLVGQ